MGDPVGVAAHIRQALKPDGTWMVVEPFANDDIAANLNPIGRMFYSASTMICTPGIASARSRPRARHASRPEAADRSGQGGGFSRVRIATQTPFNLVLEARP